MIQARQALTTKYRVGGRFEPADSADGKIRLPLGEGAKVPGCGSGAIGRVFETRNRLRKGKHAISVAERFRPVLRIAIAAGIDKLLELAVGDFVAVDPVVRQQYVGGDAVPVHSACDPDHPGRRLVFSLEPDALTYRVAAELYRNVAWLRDAEAVVHEREMQIADRRRA